VSDTWSGLSPEVGGPCARRLDLAQYLVSATSSARHKCNHCSIPDDAQFAHDNSIRSLHFGTVNSIALESRRLASWHFEFQGESRGAGFDVTESHVSGPRCGRAVFRRRNARLEDFLSQAGQRAETREY